MNRINAIYARQSVDRADSISIESQIEFCKYELKGGSFREYKDRGYSGKNTTRPQLQQLLADIRRGEVEKVIVYKLDRMSRSILAFSNMMELFQQYQVEFVSSTEKFDTSTPMGRAMLSAAILRPNTAAKLSAKKLAYLNTPSMPRLSTRLIIRYAFAFFVPRLLPISRANI